MSQLASQPRRHLFVTSDQILPGNLNEAFLDSAHPSSLAATILAGLDVVKPWRILPEGHKNREWIRVLAIVLLMPWTLVKWRRSANAWCDANTNRTMAASIQAHEGQVVVITEAFGLIATPLFSYAGLSDSISCSLFAWRGRRHFTSAERVADSTFAAMTSKAIVLTSSENDEHLLVSCHTPILTHWPESTPTDTLAGVYIPLRYVHNTKNPHRLFIKYAWLQDDLYVALLAFSFVGLFFPLQMVAIGLASAALWISYEVSYHENDVLGAEREVDPMLPTNFDELRGSVPVAAPWAWATGLSLAAGAFAAAGSGRGLLAIPVLGLSWLAVIVTIRIVFAIFNRLKKPARVLPHLALQVGKYFGYAVLSTLNPVGAGLALAQVIYRWFPYAVYRWHKDQTFIEEPLTRTRLAIFWAFSIPFVVQDPGGLLLQFCFGSLYFGRRALTTYLKLRATATS